MSEQRRQAEAVLGALRDQDAREHAVKAIQEAREALRRAMQVHERRTRPVGRILAVGALAALGAAAVLWRSRSGRDEDIWEPPPPPSGYESPREAAGAEPTPDRFTETTIVGETAPEGPPATSAAPPADEGATSGATRLTTAGGTGGASEAGGGLPTRGGGAVAGGPSDLDGAALDAMRGCSVVDEADEEIGAMQRVYLDDDTGAPEWVLVAYGTLRQRFNFVPLQGASVEDGVIRVPFSKDMVQHSPDMDADGHLSESEEAELYSYYGLPYGEGRGGKRRLTPMGLSGDLPQG
jgi:hypothetical protein